MRWSRLFIPTLREDPGGAQSASHRLLLRAGYIRQLMSGHYTMLPLGVRVREKVQRIIREEMARIGGQELLCPTMHPAELWQRTGRWTAMGEEMFRLRDRKGADLALGMTHEEVFATLAVELDSYRQLPQIWYQLQTKFRDEPRPKAGLLRTREFTMKDAYSLDVDDSGLDASFDLHHGAYVRIFSRMAVPFVPVEASSGAMGGSDSVEFMSPCEAGEDDIVTCDGCGYAANVERATSTPAAGDWVARDPSPLPAELPTPGVRTIHELEKPPYGFDAARQIKTLVYVRDGQLLLVLLRGDHSLVEQKLVDLSGSAALRPAHAEEIRAALGASPGSLGAVDVTDLPVVADVALRGARDMVTGANRDDVHLIHVDIDRDIAVETWADLRLVEEDDPCPRCGAALHVQRALEVGHIFKLGRRYAEAFGARVTDAAGDEVTITMGSYGIGVERAMAAIVEAHHDEQGISWPISVAPFEIVVASLAAGDTLAAAEEIYQARLAAGVDVLVDDRSAGPGVKLKDIELIGVPFRLVVGPRDLAEDLVELTDRSTSTTVRVPVADAVPQALAAITRAKSALGPTPTP